MPGVAYAYYEGSWDKLPDFSALAVLKTGTVTRFDLSVAQRADNYAVRYTGYVTVPTDGQYTFFTNSDDGSQLLIGSTLVVDNDYPHGDRELAGTVGLRAGTHAFTVTYFQVNGGNRLEVSYQGPGLAKQALPSGALTRHVNEAPKASAGPNRSLLLPTNSTATLAGSGTDSDGVISAYSWSQLSGPNLASFSSVSVAAPTISGLVVGNYTFRLLVTDNLGLTSAPAQVAVSVALGTPAIIPLPGINEDNIATWGDSFTHAENGLYPKTLAELSGQAVYDGGVGGETSIQIRDRMVGAKDKHSWPSIIWAGRNDSNKPAQVKADIATMVSALDHADYLVLSICNGAGEGKGSYSYGTTIALNKDLAATYGNHYLDVRSFLVAHYDSTNPKDVADHLADIPPTSLRSDSLHPNGSGSELIAHYIYAHLGQLVSANYCQNETATYLRNSIKTADGTTLHVYNSLTGKTPLPDTFQPATGTLGSTTYYVTQAIGSFESARTTLLVNVNNCLSSGSIASVEPLFDVYPNPFSAQAIVSFRLKQAQPYKLDLYDMTGRLVQHVGEGKANAGTPYTYPVDGNSLSSGIYVLRLAAGAASRSARLTVVKQ